MKFLAPMTRECALCDFWYVRELAAVAEPANPRSSTSARRGIARKIGDAFALFRKARGRLVVPHWYEYGPLYLILAALRGDRNVVLVEFIDLRLDNQPRLVRAVYDLIVRLIVAPAMRASVLAIQVMTREEAAGVARRYGIDPKRIHFIPWPLSGWAAEAGSESAREAQPPFVFSSGRTACDWETLFAAASGAEWPLRVVCAAKDVARISSLDPNGKAQVLSEIPLEEHDRLLRSATIYALVLVDQGKSAGQVRLGTCISLGVPVVASDIGGLDGYLIDGVTALAVPPRNPAALRAAIDRLWNDSQARFRLASAASEHVAAYGRAEYFDAIRTLLTKTADAFSLAQRRAR